LRLIAQGALDGHGVETLAERLGVGARHLARLLQRYCGASPVQVAKTTRVQRAKRLLDETDLAIAAIALQAGFGAFGASMPSSQKSTAVRRARSGDRAGER
jgi:AraC family transcriptional regulator of adaptative response / DNA-3-methyladenine glycosylase II